MSGLDGGGERGAVERIAAVLADHDEADGWIWSDDEDALVYACCCGDTAPAITTDLIHPEDVNAAAKWHREHVAQAILAADREPGLREAMLAAADELDEWDGDASAALGGVSPGGLIRHALKEALRGAESPGEAPGHTETETSPQAARGAAEGAREAALRELAPDRYEAGDF